LGSDVGDVYMDMDPGKPILKEAKVEVNEDFEPVQIIDDDKYEPSGAVRVAGMYGNQDSVTGSDTKFCSECGSKISTVAKFCTECGATQD